LPALSPAAHVGLIDSQAQQPPSTSPDSAASRILEVPAYPWTNRMGRPSAACTSFGTSSVVEPGAVDPILIGRLDLNQSSMVLTPLASVRAHTPESGVGAPSQPNFLPSNL